MNLVKVNSKKYGYDSITVVKKIDNFIKENYSSINDGEYILLLNKIYHGKFCDYYQILYKTEIFWISEAYLELE